MPRFHRVPGRGYRTTDVAACTLSMKALLISAISLGVDPSAPPMKMLVARSSVSSFSAGYAAKPGVGCQPSSPFSTAGWSASV